MTYYFQTCCAKTTNSDNYFGLSNYIGDTLNLNEIYSVITPEFRACGYVIEERIPSTSKIYDGSNAILTNYGDCITCIGSDDSVSCFPPPPPASTAYTLSNECNVITIFPMGVACNPNDTKDPSYHGATDGKASVTISGGTPPYKTVWWNGGIDDKGSISPAIENLPARSYTATTTDFWLDYTAITVCTLIDPTPSPTPSPTPTPTPTPTLTLTPTVTPTNTQTPTPTIACPTCVSGSEISIGTQTWTVCNAEHITYSDGITPIPEVTGTTAWTGLTTGAWCYYANITSNGTTYGKLYNWYAVAGIYDEASLLTPSLRKQFAPTGYHVPTLNEWNTLVTFLGGDSIAGGKMKETGFCHWDTPNTAATNESGFTGLPGGVRLFDGTFTAIKTSGYWWSSTDFITQSAWYKGLNYEFANVGDYGNMKTYGHSVRLIKD